MALILPSCSQNKVKLAPEYTGVDPEAKTMVDEYLWLSAQYNITFYNKVTVGFKTIGRGNVVGLCTYGGLFREIDLDTTYWNNSTYGEKVAMFFHELTHCYCGRGHTYGKGEKYPETESGRILRALLWKVEGGPRPGYYEDGCPTSIMHPVVVDDDCIRTHYPEYMEEMFKDCKPW